MEGIVKFLLVCLVIVCILCSTFHDINTRKIVAWILVCFSIVWLLVNGFRFLLVSDWLKTTATVTEVKLRYDNNGKVTDGILYGTYTDVDGTIQEDVKLFEVSSFSIFIKGTYVGEKVRILYDRNGIRCGSNTTTIINLDKYLMLDIVSSIVFTISVIYLCLSMQVKSDEMSVQLKQQQEKVDDLREWIDFLQKK